MVWNVVVKKKLETKKIAVLIVYDDNYSEMKNLTVDNNIKHYCDLHGYTLIPYKVNEFDRHPAWAKISKSIDVIKNEDFDWLFFIDLDCLIMNPTIKLESIIDEKYSFIVPSHNIPAIDTPTITPFNTNNIITSQFLVKNDEVGLKILEDIWESKELPSHMDFHTFDYEGRQTRVTILKPEFKPFVKIVDEKILNRFWYMNSPFMVFHNLNVNNLTWQPGDFIVHVTGYKKEERIKLLSDLNFFSGGAIVNVLINEKNINFKPLLDLPYINLKLKDLDNNLLYEIEYQNLNSKMIYYINIPDYVTDKTVKLEGYNKINNLISLHKIDI